MKKDLYGILGISDDAGKSEIDKAYRKKAIEYHPDKNPENPEKAKEMFDLIKKARELLKDIGKRAEYDHKRKAKRAAKERIQQYDSKRKKLIQEMEEREKKYKEAEEERLVEKRKVSEIERIREENRRILAEEIRKQEERQRKKAQVQPAHLKVKWNKVQSDSSSEVYNVDSLRKIFSKYGKVTVAVHPKKRLALIEFEDPSQAIFAKSIELGFPSNPFKDISWMGDPPLTRPSHRPVPQDVDDFDERERIILEKMRKKEEEKRRLAASSGV